MKPPERRRERWVDRLFDVLATVMLWGVLGCIYVVRAWRWLKSREADGSLFLVMLLVLAMVLMALLAFAMFAHPARGFSRFDVM